MTKKLKIITVVGTRPEIIRLSVILNKFDKYFDSYVINSFQNSDKNLNQNIVKDLGIKGKIINISHTKNLNHTEKLLRILSKVNFYLDKIKPDAFFILGDTNSTLSSLIAKRKKIPIFHMEAGNRCFDQIVPEEINRKIVDHISDINLTYSDIARNYLIRENFPIDQIIKVGSPLKEVFNYYNNKIHNSDILKKLNLNENNFFVCSFHRSENIDDENNFKKIMDTLLAISSKFKKKIIVSTHPRTKVKLKKNNYLIKDLKNIKFIDPLIYTDYIFLQKNSLLTISDSGSINEESSIIGFKAINLRKNHERPEAMEEGTTILTNLDQNNTIRAINKLIKDKNTPRIVKDYDIDNVSETVCNLLLSYTNYINQKIWKKN